MNKKAIKEAINAFKTGECYYCDCENNPIACDMVRDETCESSIFERICLTIRVFRAEYARQRGIYE